MNKHLEINSSSSLSNETQRQSYSELLVFKAKPLFSILTSTFNRAHILRATYESLKAQTLQSLEWLIIDDGSTDSTKSLVKSWQAEAPFLIRYFKKHNEGKHRAINVLIPEAKGRFSLILDSDDTLVPDALSKFNEVWESIPSHAKSKFAGVSAQCQTTHGDLLGKPFPSKVLDSNNLEIAYIHKLGGDRKGFIRTDILKEHLFPEYQGERFLSESIVWHKIAQTYQTRYVSEVLCVTDYLVDGLTMSARTNLIKNPKGSSAFYQNIMAAPNKFSLITRFGLHINFIRYSLHANYKWKKIMALGRKSSLFVTLALLPALFFYGRDKIKMPKA